MANRTYYIDPTDPGAVAPAENVGQIPSAPWNAFPANLTGTYNYDTFLIAAGTTVDPFSLQAHHVTIDFYDSGDGSSVKPKIVNNGTRSFGGKEWGIEGLRGYATIRNVHFENCLHGGFVFYHTTDENDFNKNLGHNLIENCEFSGCGTAWECRSSYNTFRFITISDLTMVKDDNTPDDYGADAFIFGTSVVNAIEYPIYDNVVHDVVATNTIAESQYFNHDGGIGNIFGKVYNLVMYNIHSTSSKGVLEPGGHGSQGLIGEFTGKLYDSVFIDYYGIALFVNNPAGDYGTYVTDLTIENCTFYDTGDAYTFGANSSSAKSPFWWDGTGHNIAATKVYNCTFSIRSRIGNSDAFTRENNHWQDLRPGSSGMEDPNSNPLVAGPNEQLNVDPKFTDVNTDDFTLQATSTLLGAGRARTADPAKTTDLDGVTWQVPPAIGGYADTAAAVAPTADFTVTFDENLRVDIVDASTGSISSWEWDWANDGIVDSTSPSPGTHTYSAEGTYTIRLTVTGPGGSDTITKQVTVYAVPFASFTVVSSGPLAATATDTSTGTISSWAWDWTNDGVDDDTGQIPGEHTYGAAGTYTIKLTVTGSGGTSSTTRQVTVADNTAPVASFIATPIAPYTVQIINTTTGNVTSWAWDFDFSRNTDSTAQNPGSHVYSAPGTYTIILTAAGPGGSDTFEQSVTVAGAPSTGTQRPATPLHCWVDVYDATGRRIGPGPVDNIISASVTRKLDGIGTFQFSVPAADDRALSLLGNKRRVEIWVQPPDETKYLLGSGIIESNQYSENQGNASRTYSGNDMLSELKFRSTWFGRSYSESTVKATSDDLITLVPGWVIEYESPTVEALVLEARFDGANILKAIQSVVQQHGLHLRLKTNVGSQRIVQIGYFGDSDGRRINKVTALTNELQTNDKLLLAERLTVGNNSSAIVNRIVPLGGGEGTAALDLSTSALFAAASDPDIDVGTITNPDGSMTYYLENPTSVAEYGVIESVVQFKDIVPTANNRQAVGRAADALYNTAKQHLLRESIIEESYGASVKNLRRSISPGDTLNVKYRDRVFKETDVGTLTPVDYVDLDGDFYVKSVTETFNQQGLSGRLEFSSNDSYGDKSIGKVVASTIEKVEARGRTPGMVGYTYEKGYKQAVSSGAYLNSQVPPVNARFKVDLRNRFTSVDSVRVLWSSLPLHTFSLGETFISTSYNVYVSDHYPSDISIWVNGVDVTSALGGPWNPNGGNNPIEDEELDISDIILADGIDQIHVIEFRVATPPNERPVGVFSSNSIISRRTQGFIDMTVIVKGSSAAIK